jgi:hypothetical protein
MPLARRFQSVGDLNRERQQLIDGEGLAAHLFGKGLAFEQLHNDELLAVGLFDRVDRANVGVIQRGGGSRFTLETLEKLGVLRHFVGKKFESDFASEARVVGLVHDTHAATAQFAGDCVVRNTLPDQRRTACHEWRIVV